MPLILERQIGTAKKMAVWQITEPIDFFLEQLVQADNPEISGKRYLEQCCSAHLLNTLYGQKIHHLLEKDQNGKPILKGLNTSVSFSHSKDMVACLIDLQGGDVGIDIEFIRERINNMAHKFVSEEEGYLQKDHVHYHLIWGAKEVLFKIYSKKELDFLKHLSIDCQDTITGNINKDGHYSQHVLQWEILSNFILVWNV